MVYIDLGNNKEVSIKVTYNKETYNRQQKGFILYVTLHEVKKEDGYIIRTSTPFDNTNFKHFLEASNRYNAKKENKFNEHINNNKEVLKDLYLNKEYYKIINLIKEDK